MIITMLALALGAGAPDPDVPTVRATRLTGVITIDGRIDEAAWGKATMSGFVQSFPNEGAGSRQGTDVHVVVDDAAMYVGARLHDSAPDSIVALLTRRDRNSQSDLFAFFLDPYGDRRSGYRFAVTAAGAQSDGVLYNDDFRDDSWDGVWASAVHRDSLGWSVELRIPLAQLRRAADPGRAWGINAGRVIGRYNETSYLTLRPQQGSGFVSRFAFLEGMNDVERRQRLEFIPYATQRAEYRAAAPGNPFRDGSRNATGAGADLRMGIGSTMQLDATILPDFGQVEVDPAVVNLTDVEVRFEERRPFFVEGNSVFRFGFGGSNNFMGFGWASPDPIYFRRIGRAPQGRAPAAEFVDAPNGVSILGAAKFTGKVGQWNVGALTAMTQREHARLWAAGQESESEIEPFTAYGIARAQRDFSGGRHGLGMLVTTAQRDTDGRDIARQVNGDAIVAGVDGWVTLDAARRWVVSGWGGTSRVTGTKERIATLQQASTHYFQRPDAEHLEVDPAATSLTGTFGRISLNKQQGSVLVNAAVGAVSPGFDANDAGFMARADLVNAHAMGGYRWTRRNSWRQSARTQTAIFSSWDFGGLVTGRGLWHQTNVTLRDFSSAFAGFQVSPEVDDPRATRGGPTIRAQSGFDVFGGGGTDARKSIILSASLNAWRYASPDLGYRAAVGLTYRPSSNITLSLEPAYEVASNPAQYLRAATDPLAIETHGRRYLFGALEQRTLSANLRIDWIFTPKVSFELFVQPLTSTGRYDAVRELRRGGTFDFRNFGTEGSTLDRTAGIADPDGAGPAPAILIGQPDFTFTSLRGNAVFRWEYAPGSTMFLVWTRNRAMQNATAAFRPIDAFGRLGEARDGVDVLMVKVSYWLGR